MSDLIDRQTAITTAVRAAVDWHKLANSQYSIAYCIGEAMRQLPSAEPQVIASGEGELYVPDTNVGELISRQAGLEAVESELIGNLSITEQVITENIVNDVCAKIRHLPSAQQERKTGKWILDRSGAYCCSECMEPCATYVMMRPRDKFCKMCGAKMEVEHE